MSELPTSSIGTNEQGWPAPVYVRVHSTKPWWNFVRPSRPWWKCHRVILIAGIGCFSGWLSCDEPRSRFLAAFLGAVLANGVFVVPKLVRWLPRRIGAAARWLYLAAYDRRRVQFRLRTLFLLVLLTGVTVTAWNWICRREQDRFIAAIEALGGQVTSDTFGPPWFPMRTVHSVFFSGRPLRDQDLAYLCKLRAPESPFRCDLSSSLVTDAGLPHLAKWTALDSLTLDRCQITDQGIREFARAKTGRLTFLSVVDCRGITDASLDDLLKLAPYNLEIQGTSITGR